MDLQSLSNVPGARRTRKRRGRGRASGMGKTSGRGHKGQMAHKGHKHKLGFEGGQMPLLRRLPKRGFHNPTRVAYAAVNVCELNRFEDGSEVTPAAMTKQGLAGQVTGGVKVLGSGTLSRKLTVKAQAFSASARAKIEAAGGTCEIV